MAKANRALLKGYEGLRPRYQALSESLKILLESLLSAEGLRVHVVECRAKSVESFAEKVSRPGKRYKDPLKELTDLCGCRVICYFLDDIEVVENIIAREFHVIEVSGGHENDSPNIFGYNSRHFVAKLNEMRTSLPEWTAYCDLKFEIQVRTVVQHAWSAVSHTVNYKQESVVPTNLQRRLNRLAGLFEFADEEFVAVRSERSRLKEETKVKISAGEINIAITADSVREFFENWSGLESLVQSARDAGFTMQGEEDDPYFALDRADEDDDSASELAGLARRAGLRTLDELESELSKKNFTRTLKAIFGDDTGVWTATPMFIAMLVVISNHADTLTLADLQQNGFHYSIAETVLSAAKGRRPKKN